MSKTTRAEVVSWLLSLEGLPGVPDDQVAVREQAAGVTPSQRFPESNRAEGVAGLRELATELTQNPHALGDMGPDPAECAQLATDISHAVAVLARLDALATYLQGWRSVREARGSAILDRANKLIAIRSEDGKVRAESFLNVRAYADARSQSISEGIARARSAKLQPETK